MTIHPLSVDLTIGILALQPGWIMLLKQLGLSFREIECIDTPDAGSCSVLIVNKTLNKQQQESISRYLRQGGAVLDTGYFLKTAANIKFIPKFIRTIFPQKEDPLFGAIGLLDLFSTVKTISAAKHLQKTVSLERWEQGFIAFLGLDINRLLTSQTNSRKQFYSPARHLPHEIVSRVSKGAVLKVVETILKWLIFQRQLPYLHWWYFPRRQPNIFAFRIDSDYATREQITAWYSTAHKHKIKMTWFLHGEAHRDWMALFGGFKDQEFAIHGFKHHTYHTYKKNRENIKACKFLLDQANLPYQGFAAPYGKWNTGLARAADHHQFQYASEFSLDYDNLPFYPWVDGQFSGVLQVPIHPICIGSFGRTSAAEKEIKQYFRFIFNQKLANHQPLVFYDHPGHPHLPVLDDFFEFVKEQNIANLSFGEYAHWWKLRCSCHYRAILKNGNLNVEMDQTDGSVFLHIETAQKKESFIEIEGSYKTARLDWSFCKSPWQQPQDYSRVRKFNPKLIQYSILEAYWRRKVK